MLAGDAMFFFKGTFKELQLAALKAHKPYFVLFKIQECAASRRYDSETFKTKVLADYCNANYLCYVVDGLDFMSGLDIAQLYGVTEYPTVCIFGPNGRMCQRVAGFMTGSTMHLNLEYAAREIAKKPELYSQLPGISIPEEQPKSKARSIEPAPAAEGFDAPAENVAPAASTATTDKPFELPQTTKLSYETLNQPTPAPNIADLHMMVSPTANPDSFVAQHISSVAAAKPSPKPAMTTRSLAEAEEPATVSAQATTTPPTPATEPTATTAATARMARPAPATPIPAKSTTAIVHKSLPGLSAYSPAKVPADKPFSCIYGTYDSFAYLNSDLFKVREQLDQPLWAYMVEQGAQRTYILALGAFASEAEALSFAKAAFGTNAIGMQVENLRKL